MMEVEISSFIVWTIVLGRQMHHLISIQASDKGNILLNI